MSSERWEKLIARLPPRLRPGRRRQPRFLAVDFFCGAGGTTRGLIDAGGYVIAGVDKDHRCFETYVSNNGNRRLDRQYPRYLECDIFPVEDSSSTEGQSAIIAELDRLIPRYQAMAADAPMLFAICAPCQPFTTLSKAAMSEQRKEDRVRDRGLLAEACKFVERYKPEMVLSENVAGIKDPRFGGIWDDFAHRLRELGYTTGTRVVCTSDFGIPQFRRRSILLAAKRETVASILGSGREPDQMSVPHRDPTAALQSAEEALGHFPAIGAGEFHPSIPNHATRGMSELNRKRISYARPGASNAYLEETPDGDLSLGCHRRVNERLSDRCFGDVYTRMAPEKPAPTITTKCHSITNGRFGHYDVSQLRGISLREAARLQSFEDDYVFFPKNQIEPVARMIGNAVPPKLAKFYAEYLCRTTNCD